MQTSLTSRFVFSAALAVAALGVATTAQARSDVSWSIGISSPGVYVQPAPVYLPAPPVYVQPRPVFVQPAPIYVQPRVVYGPPAYGYYYNSPDWRRAEWERRNAWRHRHHHGHDDDRNWRDGGR